MEIMIPLVIFTTFMCVSTGFLFAQGALTACGHGEKSQIVMLIVSAATMVIAGIGVFFHLEHWERIFNGFGHITSGITQELIGVVLMAVAIVVFFLMVKRSEEGVAPKWCGWMAMIVSAGMVFVMAHSYMMPSIPVWNNIPYILFFLANMLATAALGGLLVSCAKDDAASCKLCDKVVLPTLGFYALVVVVCLVFNTSLGNSAYAQMGYYFDPTLPDIVMADPAATLLSVVIGENAPLFWGGVVVVGLAIPAALILVSRKRNDGASMRIGVASVSLLCLLTGGVCWRVLLYITAIPAFAIF